MPDRPPRNAPTRRVLVTLFRLTALAVIMTAAMLPAALAVNWWATQRPVGPGTLLLLLPLAYVVWLVSLMLMFRIVLAPTKRLFPKPRYLEVVWDRYTMMQMAAIGISYQVEMLLRSLPLMTLFTTIPGFRWLFWNAYGRTPKVGRNFVCYGRLLDPDLVEIGNDVIIGGGASLTAHAFVTRNFNFTYLSGPIRIGHRVTIGANSSVAMYTVIEDDAIIQAGTSLGRNKRVGRGEVWGGTPARFVRMAEGFEHLEKERGHEETSPESKLPSNLHADATTIS